MARAFVLASCLCTIASPVVAAEWRIESRGTVQEIFSDNGDLTSGGGKPEFITSIRPGVSVNATGARLSVSLDYELEGLVHANRSERNRVRHFLTGQGDTELIEDLLFFEVRASIRQSLLSSAGAISANGITDSSNRTTTQNYSAGPILRHRFGNFADGSLGYTIRRSSSGSDILSNTTEQEITATLASGRNFTSFLWNVELRGSRTGRAGSNRDVNRRLGLLDAEYRVNRQFSLIATSGYEDIDDSTLSDRPKGFIWSAGFRAQPGPRTNLSATYGKRFEEDNISVEAEYRISERTSVNVSYTQTLRTTQSLAQNNLQFIGADEDGNLVDNRTGQSFDPIDPAFGLNDNAFRRDRFSAILSGSRGRNSFNVQTFYETRDTDATGRNESAVGGSMGFDRRLNSKTTANLNLNYRYNDFDTADGRKDHFFFGSAALSYRIYENVSSSITYFRTMRRSNLGMSNLTENSVAMSIRAIF